MWLQTRKIRTNLPYTKFLVDPATTNLLPVKVLAPFIDSQQQLINFHYQDLFQRLLIQYQVVTKFTVWQTLMRNKAHMWSMELLLRFGVNNNYVIFQNPVVPSVNVFRKHLLPERKFKKFNKKHNSTMLFGYTTGRVGFSRNQKRTFLAIDITLRAALWFVKRLHKFLFYGIKIRFMGPSRYIKRHLKYFRRFYLGNKLVKVHSILDVTPLPYNGTRQKARGRKRYRYHRYTYRRFAKMTKLLTRVR